MIMIVRNNKRFQMEPTIHSNASINMYRHASINNTFSTNLKSLSFNSFILFLRQHSHQLIPINFICKHLISKIVIYTIENYAFLVNIIHVLGRGFHIEINFGYTPLSQHQTKCFINRTRS
jgi:hypothetical protein